MTLTVGNGIRLAVAVAGLSGLTDTPLRSDLVQRAQQAFHLAAAGMALGLLMALTLPRSAVKPAQSGEAA
ncbi:hypothetical protein SJS43_02480 [Aeromonas caviae]|uniref:hypothetical protein n=1 Tax=Aeromonas caviae TaxID=648 RepID=UPI0029DA5449|nr:hypothetical protein [Aeromonas caviae]MDX7817960.1 hypothetical protein [Aeromonas caviae]